MSESTTAEAIGNLSLGPRINSRSLFVKDIPWDWMELRLKVVADVRFSSVDKKTEDGETVVKLCNYTDVYKNEFIVPNMQFMIASATSSEVERFRLEEGDVLVTKDSESWNDIAVAALVTASMPDVLCGYHLAHIRPDKRYLSGRYLARAFAADGIRQQFHIAANGITRFGLPNRSLSNAIIPIPPLQQQLAIADFLDFRTAQIDSLIAKKERLLECLKHLWQSTLFRILAPTSGNQVLPLRRFLLAIEQGWSPNAEQRIADETEWGVIKVGAVRDGTFLVNEQKALPRDLEGIPRFEISEGDFLMTRGNTPELVADVCIVPKIRPRLMISDLHYRLTFNERKVDKTYVMYWFLSGWGRQQIEANAHGTSNSMVKVSQSDIRSWNIAVRPLEEQRKIVALLADLRLKLDAIESKVTSALAYLDHVRHALITAAVTGQIDVSKYQRGAICQ